jgi:hypothetical protein
MDSQGTLMIAYECSRCSAVQRRAFRHAQANDEIICSCDARAVLDESAYEVLKSQVDELRRVLARINVDRELRL